jgi:Tol biopolymer transport system component
MATPTQLGERRRSLWQRTLTPAIVGLLVVQWSGPTGGAFPGVNGLIGFTDLATGTLFGVEADGTGLVEIPNTSGKYLYFFSWSPDGRRLVFATPPAVDEPDEIYVMDVDGSNLTRLTFFDGTDEEPTWSPDGSQIVWQRECDIWVMNADGSGQHNLTQPPGDCTTVPAGDFSPKWSPEGTRIAFVSYRDGPLNIFTMDPDGGGVVNVSRGSASDYEPDWSPDGGKMVFRSSRDGQPGDFYVMDADGANQTRLTFTPTVHKHDPVWSPDGSLIAFIGTRSGNRRAVYTMNPDGSNVRGILAVEALRIDWQPTPGPDLLLSSVSTPPAHVAPNATFTMNDTVLNQGSVGSGNSTTSYFLSLDDEKSSDDKRVGSRVVAAIPAGESSSGTSTLRLPSTTALGTYRLIACADALRAVAEANEINNCVVAEGQIAVSRPDLRQETVSNPPAQAVPGSNFIVSDTVHNASLVTSFAATTRYYLSEDPFRSAGDLLLTGKRSVPALAAGVVNQGSAKPTVPSSTPFGVYYFLACADDLNKNIESDETNNCHPADTTVTIQP